MPTDHTYRPGHALDLATGDQHRVRLPGWDLVELAPLGVDGVAPPDVPPPPPPDDDDGDDGDWDAVALEGEAHE